MSHRYKRGDIYWLAYHRRGKLYRESLKTKDLTTAKYLQAKKDQELSDTKYLTFDTPVIAVLEEYKASCAHSNVQATLCRDEARIRKFLEGSGVKKINDITDKIIQNYFNDEFARGIAPITVNRILATLKAWLNFAVRRRYIQENPAKGIKRYRLPENPPRFLTHDEVKKVLKIAKKEDIYHAVAAAIYTGMRKSELFTLEWPDVDFARDTITVRNKADFITKSKRFRVIPLHPALKPILARIQRKQGRCFDTINHRRAFGRIVRKSKLKPFGWHDLRHTFASHLAMRGVDLVTISKLLGHSDIKTTMIYSHLTGDHIKTSLGRLNF